MRREKYEQSATEIEDNNAHMLIWIRICMSRSMAVLDGCMTKIRKEKTQEAENGEQKKEAK